MFPADCPEQPASTFNAAFNDPKNNQTTRKKSIHSRKKPNLRIKTGFASISTVLFAFLQEISESVKTDLFLETAFMALTAFLLYLEHSRSKSCSNILIFTWTVSIISHAIRTRSGLLLNQDTQIWYNLAVIVFALVLIGLELVPKDRIQYLSLDEGLNVTPEDSANLFSLVSFSWMNPLIRLGKQKSLELDDLWDLKREDTSASNSEQFMKYWSRELLKERPSLFKALFKSFGLQLLSAGIFKVFQDSFQFLQPYLLQQMLGFIQGWSSGEGKQGIENGFLIAFLMLLTALLQTVFVHQYFHTTLISGMRIRSALVTTIYRKSLTLSNQSRQQSTVGEITNLMSVDSELIVSNIIHMLWSGPFQIGLALYLLHQSMGAAIFAGVAVMILMIPINGVIGATARKFNRQQMKNKDGRAKLMDELLSGIKVIKLYAWEIPFKNKVNQARSKELGMLKKIATLMSIQSFTWMCTPFLVSVTTFTLYSYISDEPLTSSKIFVSLSLFNLLQFPMTIFPNVISGILDASVSISRLHSFLTSDDLDEEAVNYEPSTPFSFKEESIQRVIIENASFSWFKDPNAGDRSTLKNINLKCNDGSLTCIVGSVGSGKSSLISAILGEMYKHRGSVTVKGSIAYVPQTAWIMNDTLRENILFGSRYDERLYRETLYACGLEADLAILAAGDMTEIGERGINLSGGQKQRISLARAVYSGADIILLDDSLSAVDAHVGQHIFQNVIGPKGLLKSKTRIFVTHGLQYLPEADNILVLENGSVIESGSHCDLINANGALSTLVKDHGGKKLKKELSTISEVAVENAPKETNAVAELKPHTETQAIISKEDTFQGSVSWSVYKAYVEACSYRGVFMFLGISILVQSLSIGQNLYLANWANENDTVKENTVSDKEEIFRRLGTYALLGISSSVLIVFQVLTASLVCGMTSSKKLHYALLDNVMRMPMSFFDTNPLGRILNRFSKDIYNIDEVLPRSFQGLFRTFFSVIAVLTVNTLSSPYFVLFVAPLAILYQYYRGLYLHSSRELQRLESSSRSPIYAHFQETLGGASSIRAYKQEHRFINSNETKVDLNKRAYYPYISANRWLAVRLEAIGSIVVFASGLFGVLSILITGTVSASVVGLAITYSMTITQTLNMMVRMSCDIESQIISMERIKEYIDLPQEAPYEKDDHVRDSWPEKGVVEFEDYSVRYREGMDLVLKNISLHVNPGEKVGIVGRTGAGKSSLTLGIFRILEPANGKIVIDGVDITILGLRSLRSRLTIIPQDPVLFAGTIRENLDPFGTYQDHELWSALENSNLKEFVSRHDEKLNYQIAQGGENLSVGQRQLICLARALLRKTKVLILDEATAAVDYETDSIIQQTIRREFKDCTILTIAHRINTVTDYDKILLLDKGEVAEFDIPQNLLKDKKSRFYSLAKEAGL